MFFSQIVAMGQNREIGKNNQLPWHISEDLKYFKAQTSGKIIIMGRNTFESIGSRALPKRCSIVISTKSAEYAHLTQKNQETELYFVSSWSEAKELSNNLQNKWPSEAFVIGGAQVYKSTIQDCNKLYITEVEQSVDGADCFYPEFNKAEYSLLTKEQKEGFAFCVYQRL